jgi:hypothetical protein
MQSGCLSPPLAIEVNAGVSLVSTRQDLKLSLTGGLQVFFFA